MNQCIGARKPTLARVELIICQYLILQPNEAHQRFPIALSIIVGLSITSLSQTLTQIKFFKHILEFKVYVKLNKI